MKLVEKTIIKPTAPQWHEIMNYCRLSNNLYNATLYDIRQHYFTNKMYKKYAEQHKEFVLLNNSDYRALPTKISKQTMRLAHQNMNSFFTLLKLKQAGKYDKKVNLPKYKTSGGLYQLIVDKESIGARSVECNNKGLLEYVVSKKNMGLKFYSKVGFKSIKQVRFIPKGNHIVQEVVYEVDDVVLKPDNHRYASVDLGVNNLMAVYTNTGESLLYNGRPVKNINQFYNKERARLVSQLGKGVYDSHKLRKITFKRNNKVNDYFHKVSADLVNRLVFDEINTLVIGYNPGWKQDINIGKRNNQNFVGLPFYKLVEQLMYKCELAGINVVMTEESYTSKTSFFDCEKPVKHSFYVGSRVSRGLFKGLSHSINADVNGAGQIMRKVVPDTLVYTNEGIVGCRTPRKIVIQ